MNNEGKELYINIYNIKRKNDKLELTEGKNWTPPLKDQL